MSSDKSGAADSSVRAVAPVDLLDILLLGVLLVAAASVTTWAVVGGLSGADPDLPGNAFVMGSVLLASALTLVAALRRWRHGLPVAPWLGMTIACHVWLAGAAISIVIQFYLGRELTVPSIVDIPLLAFAPIVVWSFRSMFRRQRDRLGRLGFVLDCMVIGLLAIVAVVTPILGERVSGAGLPAGDRAVVMLWLLSAVLAILPAVPMALTAEVGDRIWVWPIVTGFVALGMGHTVYANGLRHDVASASHPVALCWSLGFLLIAGAAISGGWQSRAVAERQAGPRGAASWQGGYGVLHGRPVLRTGTTSVAAGVIGLLLLFIVLQADLGPLPIAFSVLAVAAITLRIVLAATQTERLLRARSTLESAQRLEAGLRRSRRPGVDPVTTLEQAVASALGFQRVWLRRPAGPDDAVSPAGSAESAEHSPPDDATEPPPEATTISLVVDGEVIGTGWFSLTDSGPASQRRIDALLVAIPWIGPALLVAERESAALRRREMVSRLAACLRDDSGAALTAPLDGRLDRIRSAIGAVTCRIDHWDSVTGTYRLVAVSGATEDEPPMPGVIGDQSLADGRVARFMASGSRPGCQDSPIILSGVLSPAGATPVMLTVVWEAGAGPVTSDDPDDTIAVTLLNLIAAGLGATSRATQWPERRDVVRYLAKQAMTEARDRQGALDGLLRAAIAAGLVSHAAILLWAPISDEYEVISTTARAGARPLFIRGERSSLAMLPAIRRVVEVRQSIHGLATGITLAPEETGLFEEVGVTALALIPLLAGDRCFGALILGSAVIEPFPADALTLFAELGRSAAVAIERDRAAVDTPDSSGTARLADAENWTGQERASSSRETTS